MSNTNGPAFVAGKYRARITTWGLGKTKTGAPQLVVSFMPLGMYAGDKIVNCPAYERSTFRTITENTIEYLVQDLERLGYPHDTFDQLDPNHPQSFNFGGIEVDVACKHETFEGKTRDKWSFSWGGAGVQVVPLERKDVSQLNALFAKKLKKPANGAARPAAAAATRAAEPVGDANEEEVF